MTDPLPIQPFTTKLDASIELPGSKSITNRALILAALAEGQTKLEGALFSRDTRIMLAALKTLGFQVSANETAHSITVKGEAGKIPVKAAELNIGNAGTAARFLTAFLALAEGSCYKLDGDPAMRKRPMSGLLDALIALDAAEFEFHGEPGHFPFTLKGKGYKGGSIEVDASSSSQILSALLLSAPATNTSEQTNSTPTILACPSVRPFYVAITLKMRETFGAAPVEADASGNYTLQASHYSSPGSYAIEPDLSAASYFLALTLLQGGTLKIPNVGTDPLQGDAHFVEVLNHHGLHVDAQSKQWTASNSNPNDIQRGHREIDFNTISDTFLTYAAISPLLGESIRICGIGHTRRQETDRIAGMATELAKLGQLVKEEPDALTISTKPNELHSRALKARNEGKLLTIDTYEDHRFAMSFGILGSFDLLEDGQPWLAINDPACCSKTFPGFFEALNDLRV
jgi:3-phosphoshikimate 1-carboxyvinyltransferase